MSVRGGTPDTVHFSVTVYFVSSSQGLHGIAQIVFHWVNEVAGASGVET